jgi:hypothetical protein
VIGLHLIGHEAKAKVCSDRRSTEIIRIEDGLPAATIPHVVEGGNGDGSPKSVSPVTGSHCHHVQLTGIGVRQPLIRGGGDVIIAANNDEDAVWVYARIAQKQPFS